MASRVLARLRSALLPADRENTTSPLDADRTWLALSMAVATVIALVYVLTHPYPALESGLFLVIAERILANGYALPVRIPGYTAGGLPFAYPPLWFYGVAIALDAGADPLSLARVVPGVVTVLYLIPFYYLARELLGSVRAAGLSTALFAVVPAVLEWHLSAGGIVRAPALLCSLTGLYCGVRLFETGERRWIAFSTVLFAVTILSHPIGIVFFGSSFLVFFAFLDRSRGGLLRGAFVAVGGFALAAPWWLSVVTIHGLAPFVSAAGTQGGFGGGLSTAPTTVPTALFATLPMWPWYLVVALGALSLLARREFLVPAWFLVLLVLTNKPRYAFVPGAMIAGVFLVRLASRSAVGPGDARRPIRARRPGTRRALVAALCCLLVVSGGVYAAGAGAPFVHDESLPVDMDHGDIAATAWVERETPPGATFVVLGDMAEWFPLLANRTLLVGPWGSEWTSPAEYTRQQRRYRTVSTCRSATCLTTAFERADVSPTYVYVPTDRYTIDRVSQTRPTDLLHSLKASPRYRLVFENRGAAVFRVTPRAG